MLTRLGLRNFKAFGDEMQYADLAPITLIYGPNSGGKSSIIQALLMLKQSSEAAGRFSVMELVPRGSDVDLGSIDAFIHNHDASRKFEIKVAVAAQEYLRPFWRIGRSSPIVAVGLDFSEITTDDTYQLKTIQFKLEEVAQSDREGFEIQLERSSVATSTDFPGRFCWRDETSTESFARYIKNVFNNIFAIATQDDPTTIARFYLDNFKSLLSMSNEEIESRLRNFQFEPTQGLQLGLVGSGRYADKTDNELIDAVNFLAFETWSISISSELDRMSHIGPHRQAPQRVYEAYGRIRRDTAGGRGEFTPHILGSDENIVTSTNEWFDKCEIPYRLEVHSQKGDILTGDRTVLELSDKRAGGIRQLTLTDVGFGINQILPVIVEGVIASNRTICVEQPEIHLHPRLQANIADLLIETSKADENNAGNQWLVETHSELLVLRLQRRIREGIISHKDVSVLYVDPQDDGGSEIRRLELDEDGTFIDEWPQGFFEEGYREIMGY